MLGGIYNFLFKEREILLRSDGRVRFLHLTPRLQVCLAILISGILIWGAGGSYLSWREYEMIKVRDGRLTDAKVAFNDLLEEISIYQRKVAGVTLKLRQNQSDLVRQFAWADALEAEVLATAKTQPAKHKRLAAITEAREAMDQHVRQLQGDLRLMTDVDTALKSSVKSMQSELLDAAAERQKGYQARAILIAEFRQLSEAHEASQANVAALEGQTETLDRELTQSRKEVGRAAVARAASKDQIASLQQSLEGAVRRGDELEARIAETRTALITSRREYERISDLRAELDVKVAGLEGALQSEQDRGNAMEVDLRKFADSLSRETGAADEYNSAKEPLSTRIASLLGRLTILHQARSTVLESIHTRTEVSVEEAEGILGRTGLNVETVLAKIVAWQSLDEGGPFIAALPDGAELTGFAGTVSGLERQLNRLTALQTALRAIPLISPLDGYRLSSAYGKRRDPITKKWAMHGGVDLSAPFRAAVRTAAPGIVTIASWKGRYGRMIEIDHGFGIRTRYGHLRKILVKKGQRIKHREKIGLVGNSGRSTGPHLHYEILSGTITVDPWRFIKAGKYVFKK